MTTLTETQQRWKTHIDAAKAAGQSLSDYAREHKLNLRHGGVGPMPLQACVSDSHRPSQPDCSPRRNGKITHNRDCRNLPRDRPPRNFRNMPAACPHAEGDGTRLRSGIDMIQYLVEQTHAEEKSVKERRDDNRAVDEPRPWIGNDDYQIVDRGFHPVCVAPLAYGKHAHGKQYQQRRKQRAQRRVRCARV